MKNSKNNDKRDPNKRRWDEGAFLKQMLSINGFDDDLLGALGTAALLETAGNESVEQLAEEALQQKILEQVLDKKVFARPSGQAFGPILLGFSLETEVPEPVGLYPVDLTQNILVVGTHGGGKTVLLRNILRFVIENYS